METFICKYCGKECKSKLSLIQHELRCKKNPNRIPSNFEKYNNDLRTGVRISWCKGLTKDNSSIIKNRTNLMLSNYKEGKNNFVWSKGLTKETDDRILNQSNNVRDTISNKIINDTWHNCRSKKYYNDNISFDSEWELYFYKYVKSLNIEILRCKDRFQYEYNGLHNYIPDFYIPSLDLYIEIKGYPSEKDIAKWNQFNKKLNIYFGHNLNDMNIISFTENKDRINKYESYVPEKFKQRINI